MIFNNLENEKQFEKHHILKLGKIKVKRVIKLNKRYQERYDYEEQRVLINKLYPNKKKKVSNYSHKEYLR